MFGYITPVLSVLSDEQKQRYRSFYCGVCHALRNRYGQISRLSLSNDMTFMAILLSSLYEPETNASHSRCLLHPLKSHIFLSSSLVDYAADMNALLFYYKCEDQRMDERSFTGTAGERIFRKAVDDAQKRWPLQSEEVRFTLAELWQEEKKSSPDPDRLCNLSGQMLGAVFVPKPDDPWSSILRTVGTGLGRFVYWMDAWEDYDEDLKKNRFNPLKTWHDRPDYEDFCRETLELLIADAAEGIEILPLEQDLDILRNVVYSGVWQRYYLIMERRQRKEGIHAK